MPGLDLRKKYCFVKKLDIMRQAQVHLRCDHK